MEAHSRNLLLTGMHFFAKLFTRSIPMLNCLIFHFIPIFRCRKSLNYSDDDAYYKSKDAHNSYGSITAIKNR